MLVDRTSVYRLLVSGVLDNTKDSSLGVYRAHSCVDVRV